MNISTSMYCRKKL